MPAAVIEQPTWRPPVASPPELAVGLVAGAGGRLAAPVLRGAVQGGLHRIFQGDRTPPAPAPAEPDPGWFGPTSVTWAVHADMSMFVAGIAALMLQSLHPLAMAGVADHSDFRRDPLGRLRTTAGFVGITTYGTSAEAAAACARVRRVHRRVVGTTPDGRPYEANDPELIDWVHVAEFACFAAAHRRFAADALTDHDLDLYAGEVARIAVELGDPSPPRDWTELDAALQHHRASAAVGEQAREAWRFLASAPVPGPARAAYRLLWSGAVACLPPWARRLWGVSSPSTAELAGCRALVRGLGSLLGEPPGLVQARARLAPVDVSASAA